MTASDLIRYSTKLGSTWDSRTLAIFFIHEFGYGFRDLLFFKELYDYLNATMICETLIHPNGYNYYQWSDI